MGLLADPLFYQAPVELEPEKVGDHNGLGFRAQEGMLRRRSSIQSASEGIRDRSLRCTLAIFDNKLVRSARPMEKDSGSFRDLVFDDRPGNYREFRRKTILAVAGLEEKHLHLAGPRLLTRLQDETYRATEHLSVADLRRPDGWMQVIRALDAHYAFLPETELHEAIDHFLFDLRKRPHEGATAFASRFKTALARVQALIAQDRKTAKTRKPTGSSKRSMDSPVPSSVGFSDDDAPSDGSKPKRKSPSPPPTDTAEPAAASASAAPKAAAASPGGEHDEPKSARSHASSEHGSRRRHSSKGSRGTFEADKKAEQLRMARMLGTIEIGHTKPSPIFPSTVLGHRFMRSMDYRMSSVPKSFVQLVVQAVFERSNVF
eukprot:s680_g22.t1